MNFFLQIDVAQKLFTTSPDTVYQILVGTLFIFCLYFMRLNYNLMTRNEKLTSKLLEIILKTEEKLASYKDLMRIVNKKDNEK